MKRAGRTLLGACAAVAALGACGDDSADDRAAVRRTIHCAVRAAVVNHDPRAACAYATPAGRALLLHWYRLSYERRFRSCEDVVRFEVRQQRDDLAPALRRTLGVVGRVQVDGDKALADVAEEPGAQPYDAHVSLRKVAGRWLIEDSTVIPRGM